MLRRFVPLTDPLPGRPLWFQACSVGEVTTAKPIVAAARARWPDSPILLTSSTQAGHRWAATACPEVDRAWFPFDHRWTVSRFFRLAHPRALILVETEIWPAVIREAHRQGVPTVVLNGRLSDKHFRRYLRVRKLLLPVFSRVAGAGVQNEEYAERFRALGVPAQAVRVTGNTKFDGVRVEPAEGVAARVRVENGFPAAAPLLLFGSTRPGDEALAARCWLALRERFPDLRLVVAPRHLERLDEAVAPFHEPLRRRSEVLAGHDRTPGARVFVLDTVGDLRDFYAAATVAVIGGSFYPGVEGHNPLEAAAWGVATVFGPHMRNFIDPARALVDGGGAVQVRAAEDLLPTLDDLLGDGERRRRIGERGRAAILAHQGAIARSLDFLDGFLR